MDHFAADGALSRNELLARLAVVATAAVTLAVGLLSSGEMRADSSSSDMPVQAWPSTVAQRPEGCVDAFCRASRPTVLPERLPYAVISLEFASPSGAFSAFCTGTLLEGGRKVITAAHCVESPDASLNSVMVRFGGADDAWLPVTGVQVHRRWFGGSPPGPERDTAYDVALLQLSEPMVAVAGLPVTSANERTTRLYAWSAQWTAVSGAEPLMRRCDIAPKDYRESHTHLIAPCDFQPGGSGGPLLTDTADGPAVIGVLHAVDSDGANYWAAIAPLDALESDMATMPVGGVD